MIKILKFITYWSIVFLPFSVVISTGLSNTVLGFLVFGFFVRKIIKREALFINTSLNFPYLIFIIIALLSVKNSISYGESFHGITKILKAGLIFIVCAEEIRDLGQIKKILISIICGICITAIDGFWQLRFGWDFIRGQVVQSSSIALARPTAGFPNPNVMGIYLSLVAPLVIGLTVYYYKGKKLIYYGIASLLAVYGIYITLSRGSGLGLFFSVLFLAIVRKHKLLIVLLLSVFLAFPFVMPKNIKNWAKEVNYNPLVFIFNQDRISMYMNTVNMVSHHPFIGVGVNTYSMNYGRYKTKAAESYANTQDGSYAQSNYFQLTGEMGLIGLGVFLWILFVLFKELIRDYKLFNDNYLKILSVSLLACFVAFLINGLTESSLFYSRVAIMFWFFAGLSLSLKKLIHEKDH